MVPENIHTLPQRVIGNSEGGVKGQKPGRIGGGRGMGGGGGKGGRWEFQKGGKREK